MLRDLILSKFKQIVFVDEIDPDQSFGLGPLTNNTPWIRILKSFDFHRQYILFNSFIEGYFPMEHIERLHGEIRHNNYPSKKIIWITSNLCAKRSYVDWKNNSQYKYDDPINVIGSFFWLDVLMNGEYADGVTDDFPRSSACIINKEIKDRLFLFLNNKKHLMRDNFFKTIKSFGGLDVSIYSFIEKGIFLDEVDVDDLNNMASWRGWGLENLNQYYENTYFETFCSCDEDEVDRRIFMCDKVVKPLVQGHPFIGLYNPFVLKSLRELGFETFPELFNESYDDVVNINDRFDMVVKEIKRYTDMWNNDKDEVHNIFSQDIVLQKRIHNQNWSFNNNIIDDVIDKVGELYEFS